MNVMAYLLMLAIAAVVAVFSGMFELAITHGGADLGYLLFVLPAAGVSILAAMAVYHLLRWPDDPAMRRGGFVLVASSLTTVLSAISIGIFDYSMRSPLPEYVYVHGPGSIEITLPTEAVVDEVVPVQVRRRDGLWHRIRYKDDLHEVGQTFSGSPPPPESHPPRDASLVLRAEPSGGAILNSIDDDTGDTTAIFRNAGTIKIWAERFGDNPQKSNVATVLVRPK